MNNDLVTVFYDGGCPLCSREINHYRRLAKSPPIHWIDVTQEGEATLGQCGISKNEAIAVFHVLDRNGRLAKGAEAFVLLWQELPYYRRLAALCRALRLLPLMQWAYARFARWHYRQRCRDGVCT